MVLSFLPESFGESEHEALKLLLFTTRVTARANLARKAIRAQFKLDNGS